MVEYKQYTERRERIVSQRRSFIAMAMCVVMLLAMIVSSAYIVHEAAHPHECAGKDCPICQFIARIEQLRRGFGMLLLALMLTGLVMGAGIEAFARMSFGPAARGTLVGRKIRLND